MQTPKGFEEEFQAHHLKYEHLPGRGAENMLRNECLLKTFTRWGNLLAYKSRRHSTTAAAALAPFR